MSAPATRRAALYPPRETNFVLRPLTNYSAKLTAVGDTAVYVYGSVPGDAGPLDYDTFEAKDFSQYRPTLQNGESYLIDQQPGLQRMTDPNGNTLTVNANGITHSGGRSIAGGAPRRRRTCAHG